MPNSPVQPLNITADITAEALARLVETWPAAAARVQLPDATATIRTATVVAGHAPLRAAPDDAAGQLTDLFCGESFMIVEESDGWLRGQAAVDGYIGYVRATAIGGTTSDVQPTHRIAVPLSHIYDTPDIKRPPRLALPMGARLSATGQQENGFSAISTPDGTAWVPTPHIRAISELPTDYVDADYVDTALAFIGSPYLWGGRTIAGIDCSALVQISLAMAGHAVPRDSDMQEAVVGAPADPALLKRGDLVFFPGHVGMMTGARDIVHANATFMAVTHEPLADLVDRLRSEYAEPITSVRRLI